MSELRKDLVSGNWVIVSTERAKRPEDYTRQQDTAQDDRDSNPAHRQDCPFCLGNESQTPPEIQRVEGSEDGGDHPWDLRVVPNKYPALAPTGEPVVRRNGMYQYISGVGAHEVLIETPSHNTEPYDQPIDKLASVMLTYRDRMNSLQRDRRYEYISVFRNHGASAGASLEHPHSQIIACPIVPGNIEDELRQCKDYYDFASHCVVCDMIKEELDSGVRLIAADEEFVVAAPYASRMPFETWIMPRRHNCSFTSITDGEAKGLARNLARVLLVLADDLGDPNYNYYIHTSPCRVNDLKYYHWHIEIIPKITIPAGFEFSTGIHINVTSPEAAAAFLREKMNLG